MFSTVVFVLGALVFLGFVAAFFKVKEPRTGKRGSANWAFPVIGLVIFAIVGGLTTIGTVGPKKDGVVTSLNKPTGEVYEAGPYLKAPWKSVHEMDSAIQTRTYTFDVQMAGGAKATLNVYPSWQISAHAAPELFQQFKTFDNVVESLFEQQLITTANEIFGSYNPLTNVDPKTGELKKSKADWGAQLKSALENNPLIKGRLDITNISIPIIQPDKNTQDNLNLIVAEFAKGSVLDQQKLNADKAKAISETNAQVDKVTRCLEIAEKVGKEPGLCLSQGTGVIVNSSK